MMFFPKIIYRFPGYIYLNPFLPICEKDFRFYFFHLTDSSIFDMPIVLTECQVPVNNEYAYGFPEPVKFPLEIQFC